MILYHTSTMEIPHPDIHYGRKNADFGQGFYLTPDRAFTYRWAQQDAVVNEYTFDEADLSIHRFSRSAEWFEYIFQNRRAKDLLNADVVVGPIANDTIFDTLGILTSGYLTPEESLRLLMIGPEYTQLAIKTEKAAARLHWIRAERIERLQTQALQAEQEAYQQMFAEEMTRLSES